MDVSGFQMSVFWSFAEMVVSSFDTNDECSDADVCSDVSGLAFSKLAVPSFDIVNRCLDVCVFAFCTITVASPDTHNRCSDVSNSFRILVTFKLCNLFAYF